MNRLLTGIGAARPLEECGPLRTPDLVLTPAER
jgi:hypothetical protein